MDRRLRIANKAGALTTGSSGLNCAIASSVNRPISAPPGTRFHVVSTPSRMSCFADSPASGKKDSIVEPAATALLPISKPCVLCIARLRAAIEANASPSTGSMPPTSIFTAPVPSPRDTAAPVPGRPAL